MSNINLVIKLSERAQDLSLSLSHSQGYYVIKEANTVIYESISIDCINAFLKGYSTALINNGLRDE